MPTIPLFLPFPFFQYQISIQKVPSCISKASGALFPLSLGMLVLVMELLRIQPQILPVFSDELNTVLDKDEGNLKTIQVFRVERWKCNFPGI